MSTNVVYQTIPWRTDVENMPKDGTYLIVGSKDKARLTSIVWTCDLADIGPEGGWRICHSTSLLPFISSITRWCSWNDFDKQPVTNPNDFGILCDSPETERLIMPKDDEGQPPNYARRGIESPLDYEVIRFWQDIFMNSIIHDNDPNLAKLLADSSLEARKKMIEGLKK